MSAWNYWACFLFILTNKIISHIFVCVSMLHVLALKVSTGNTVTLQLPQVFMKTYSVRSCLIVPAFSIFPFSRLLQSVFFLSFFMLNVCYI